MRIKSANSCSVTTSTCRATFDLNVLVLHQGLATGLRANALLDAITSRLEPAVVLRKHFWRSDQLHVPADRQSATVETVPMDIILLSANVDEKLPAMVQDWMSRYLEHLEKQVYAIGVLLDGRFGWPRVDNLVIDYMQDCAEQAGADFFYGSHETVVNGIVAALGLEQKQCDDLRANRTLFRQKGKTNLPSPRRSR